MRLRQHYSYPALLESNDIHAHINSRSIVGVEPLIKITVSDYTYTHNEVGNDYSVTVSEENQVPDLLYRDLQEIKTTGETAEINGFFGHSTFESVKYFDTISLPLKEGDAQEMPEMLYYFFRFVVVFDHYHDTISVVENCPESEDSQIDEFIFRLNSSQIQEVPIKLGDELSSSITDEEFRDLVEKGKYHCQRGDVFQIVLSRQFSVDYTGDDFEVYRRLRSVNPSPYLFYFDFGKYSIFGSSPEQQLVISDGVAQVNPIAGTYKRTGDDEEDAKNALALSKDPKEVAEHIMLVDLARNDLGRHTTQVEVTKLKEIHFYSHVIHLVSQVHGQLDEGLNPIRVYGDTFPAGTLSGAPKYRAMELIHEYEKQSRNFYGGGIGYFGLDGTVNHAIVIRSIMSHKGKLYLQAGAGIVNKSDPESELQEVFNKIGALKNAISTTKQ